MIKNSVLRKAKRPILNLHMSYLPYNKGAHPNFWSFYDNTKKGLTMHEIDKSLDTGPIVYQKEIKLNIFKNKKISFKKTYNILFLELEKLFIKNFTSIILNNYKKKINIKSKGKINKSMINFLTHNKNLSEMMINSFPTLIEKLCGKELFIQRRAHTTINAPGDDQAKQVAHYEMISGISPFTYIILVISSFIGFSSTFSTK